MVELVTGDLFKAPVEVLVNATNAHGVSGKGIALSFKHKYPTMAKSYREWCEAWHTETGHWPIGKSWIWGVPESAIHPPNVIVCLPTKEDWTNRTSKIEWIKNGLLDMKRQLDETDWESIALPALGCGEGKLTLSDLKPVVDMVFQRSGYRVKLYAGLGDFGGPVDKTAEQDCALV